MSIKQGFLDGTQIGKFAIQKYACHSSNYRTRLINRTIDYVVVHYTGNTKDLAINNCKYYAVANRSASAHFFVDETSIYQSVSTKNIAWHCGSSQGYKGACTNDNSIGIEMCCSGNYLVSMTTQENTIELIKYIWKEQGWTDADVDKRLWRHYDCVKSNKKCPAQFVNNPAEWTNFKNKVKKAVAKKVNLQQYGSFFNNIDRLAYIPMSNKKGETVSDAAKTTLWNDRYPDAICNAELFNMTTYAPSSGVISQGQKQLVPEAFGISFVDNKKPVFSYKNNVNAPDWIGAYPVLVRNGKINFTSVPSGLGGYRARTALAFNDNVFAIVFVTAADGCSLQDFAQAIIERGFHTAINLDGGGSTAVITPGVAYEQGRKVRGKIGIWIKGGTGNKLAQNGKKTTTTTNSSSSSMKQDKTKSAGAKLTVTANPTLNLRKSAPSGDVIEKLKKGSTVMWYGYYCEVSGTKWYYVKAPSGATGYISSQYVK